MKMRKAITYTVIAGSTACPNECPICVSRMTPDYGLGAKEPQVDWRTFEKATQVAVNHGAQYALITGKGEPTLFPCQITEYLHRLEGRPFDRRELQTEGSRIANGGRLYNEFLRVWRDHGLDVVAVSMYHFDSKKNARMFKPKDGEHYDLSRLLGKIHSNGLRTRLSCVMMEDCIDSVEQVEKLIGYAKNQGVFQLTLRTASYPGNSADSEYADYIRKYALKDDGTDKRFNDIKKFVQGKGKFCDELPHGASVYEVGGQNVCITTGLTPAEKNKDDIRQLIFFPQGWLTTSWENVMGGRIL